VATDGTLIDILECQTDAAALRRVVTRIEAESRSAVIEASGQAYWAAQQLAGVLEEVRVCDPTANPALHGRGNKNDRRDAEALARRLRMGDLQHVYRPPLGERLVFRRYFDFYQDRTERLAEEIQRWKARLRAWGAYIPKRAGYSQPKADRWLEQVDRQVQPMLVDQRRQIDQLQAWKQRAWDRLKEAGSAYWEIGQFRRIPGIGPVRAHGLSAMLMDPHRFTSASALYKYCRLGVRRRSSNGEHTAPEQLDRAGHGRLKAMAVGAVRSAVYKQNGTNEVKDFYQASLERTGGNAQNARLNTQRKLLKICWGLWKTETTYNPERFRSGAG
jgi:transposase